MKTAPEKVRSNTALHIDQDLWERVKARAEADGMKLYAVVERALEAYLKDGKQ